MKIPVRRLIGILGGMGPAATVDFLGKIVAATPACTDQDHVPVLVYGVPQIPDRAEAILNGSDAPFLPMLAGLRTLERDGAEIIAIPCNTAHFWFDRLSRSCQATLIHIADAVADSLRPRASEIRKVAIMSTRGTIAANIYQRRLAAVVGELVTPAEPVQQIVDDAIAAVKGGRLAAAEEMAEAAGRALLATGIDRVLLACTELPVALARSSLHAHCVDATDALARACVAASLAQEPPQSRAG